MDNCMNVRKKVTAFLGRHGMSSRGIDVNSVIDGLLYDMETGLSEASSDSIMGASQEMIPTWSIPPVESPKNESIIVIDAGGTNFRSSLVSFDKDGIPSISELEKTSMPGIEREYGKEEFFDTIATNLDHLKNKSKKIGFCFSYAMKMTPDGDGELISFSKEIKAKEVIGSLIGASLSDALVKRGWNRPEKISMLNDTTAALFAGAANATGGKNYSSYIGFILGTGMNTAYVESNPIKKIEGLKDSSGNKAPLSQIVVCESGLFNKVPRSDFDIEFDKTTNTPNRYVVEKMCSGAYLGPVASIIVQHACKDGLFSKEFCVAFDELKTFEAFDMDQFLYTPLREDTKLGAVVSKGTKEDAAVLAEILDAVLERSARYASALIASSVIKCQKGTAISAPVCINCDGTTFYKAYNLKNRILGYLNDVLSVQRGLHFETVSIDNDITLGSAVAAV